MRLLAIPVLASFFALPCPAQIIIGPNDMPTAGLVMRYRNVPAFGVDLNLTGPGVVWNFSGLPAGLPTADTTVSVSSTPPLYQFFFNNPILYPQNAANYAVKGPSFGFQQFTFENVYEYYKKSSTGFRNVGFGATVMDIPLSVQRDPVDWIHRFPMEYGDRDTSISAFAVEVPTLGYFGQTQWRYNHVDGWGTLLLPGGQSYQVLRVRSVLQRRDTLYLDQTGSGFAFNEPQAIEYRWLANGMNMPVMIATGGLLGQVRYIDAAFAGTPEEAVAGTLPSVFPNPAQGTCTVLLPEGFTGSLSLVDATGREVAGPIGVQRAGAHPVPLEGLAPGAYLLRLTGGAQRWSTRLLVQ